MSGKRVEPSISSVSFNCPHCGALAHQQWYRLEANGIEENGVPFRPDQEFVEQLRDTAHVLLDEAREQHEKLREYAEQVITNELFIDSFLSEYQKLPQLVNLHASCCYACGGIAIWAADRMVYPFLAAMAIAPNADMNEDIQIDFKEAVLILDASPRGGAALLRQCLQKLCAQLGESGKNINADIASLVRRGLDKRIQRALDIVRVIGNDAVYPGQIDPRDERDTAIELARLVNLIAELMITQPRQIEQLYGLLPESKRRAVEERDDYGS